MIRGVRGVGTLATHDSILEVLKEDCEHLFRKENPPGCFRSCILQQPLLSCAFLPRGQYGAGSEGASPEIIYFPKNLTSFSLRSETLASTKVPEEHTKAPAVRDSGSFGRLLPPIRCFCVSSA